jgi:hypothetical protein
MDPLPGQGCCQSHGLLFQFLFDAFVTSSCHVRQRIQPLLKKPNQTQLHKRLQELTDQLEWLGRMGPMVKLNAYARMYAQQDLPWKRAALRIARQAQQALELAVRCRNYQLGWPAVPLRRLVATMDRLSQQLLTHLSIYRDDERVLLLLVRRRTCLSYLYGANFIPDLLRKAHGSLEQGLRLVQSRLRARGFETVGDAVGKLATTLSVS